MTGAHVDVERLGDGERTALLLPGHGYTVDAPLLWYVRHTLLIRGWAIDSVRWTPPAELSPLWALNVTAELIGERNPRLVVGKSLGTFGIPAAVAAELPGLWLTPLVRQVTLRAPLARLDAHHVLVAGGADETWDPDVDTGGARRIVADAADHALETGDLDDDLLVHSRIAAALSQLVDALPS